MEYRLRSISEIGQSLLELKEYQDPLRTAEICDSKKKSEQYCKVALRIARKTLDTAYNALIAETPSGGRLAPEQVSATIRALQTNAWWEELFRSRPLADEEAARVAARDLAERVASLDTGKISSESLQHLLADIDLLRKEVNFASHQAGDLLSPGLVHEYVSAAYSVASQVMVGLVAASTTAGVTGAKVVPEVIYTAIGLTAASSIAEICRRASRNLKARTILAQLQKYHHELIEAVGDLGIFLLWLAGPDPPDEDAVDTVRSTRLAAGFLVSHVEQLALAFTWPERSAYCDALHVMRTPLDEVHCIIDGQRGRDVQKTQRGLHEANAGLQEFSHCIDGLRSDRA